jgi:hypothetical protein
MKIQKDRACGIGCFAGRRSENCIGYRSTRVEERQLVRVMERPLAETKLKNSRCVVLLLTSNGVNKGYVDTFRDIDTARFKPETDGSRLARCNRNW